MTEQEPWEHDMVLPQGEGMEEIKRVLGEAGREVCGECGGSKVLTIQLCSGETDEVHCIICYDAAGKSTGRRWPELGRACERKGYYIDDQPITYTGDKHPDECPGCQGTGIVPNLDREACDATAERAGFGGSLCYPFESDGGGYQYWYACEKGKGTTRTEAAQAALCEVLQSVQNNS